MIERITTSVDLYPNLRVEVSVQGRGRDRPMKTATAAPNLRLPAPASEADTGPEMRQRRSRDVGAEPERGLIRYEQSAVAADQSSGYEESADEVVPSLTASVLPYDPRMAQVAALYTNSGRIGAAGRTATVGTRLDAVA